MSEASHYADWAEGREDESLSEPYDVTYMVTVTIMPGQDGHPGESEIRQAVYQGIDDITTPDVIYVERV
jgi:hypothetical protein